MDILVARRALGKLGDARLRNAGHVFGTVRSRRAGFAFLAGQAAVVAYACRAAGAGHAVHAGIADGHFGLAEAGVTVLPGRTSGFLAGMSIVWRVLAFAIDTCLAVWTSHFFAWLFDI